MDGQPDGQRQPEGYVKIMPLAASTPQLRLRWTELSWSVGVECGNNEKGGQLTGVYLGEKTTFSWEWLINWFDRQQIPVVSWFDPQAF